MKSSLSLGVKTISLNKNFHYKQVKFHSYKVNFDSESSEILLCHSLKNWQSLKSEIFTLLH